jgi:hypothetical protein
VGVVTQPQPRISADFENAARALLHSATSISAAFRGTYSGSSWQLDADVWPGEALSFPGGQDGAVSAVVRSVELTYRGTVPDLVDYTIDVANDWAEELCIRTTSSVPADAWIPEAANQAVLDNLPDLAVASLSGNAIGIQTNVEAPQQGGFEVRRRDWAFGPGQDSDLVLRSPVASFVIPRSAAIEQYFIRMFDGSQPPVYSRFSSAVMVNAPFSP